MSTHYDIIFTGGGAAALSLAYRGMQSGIFANKQLLIIEPSAKTSNDKTWCFWEEQAGPFEDILFKRWAHMKVYGNNGREIVLQPGSFEYKMIRSIDFYEHTLNYLKQQTNITFLQASVDEINANKVGKAVAHAEGVGYSADTIFNSIFKKPHLQSDQNYFIQHFLGEIIQLPANNHIDPEAIHLMDFRTSQEHGTAFFYVLPLHNNQVLVEYTLFTKQVLDRTAYKTAIKAFIQEHLMVSDYEVLEEEYGEIPMTDFPFQRFDGRVVNIGSAGGDTRGSSGYTFSNIQRTVSAILQAYRKTGQPVFQKPTISKKHQLYDKTLLRVLNNNQYQGHEMFTDLFTKAPAHKVFRFLDGTSTLIEDTAIMTSLKSKHFIFPFINSI
ncbi:MAG: hypothetical protein KTR13_05210 [Saprospiraceae bacterium]|nr:hypothetical protein [Saprospiraceae bacterium]